jgi:chromosome segregation ATPase
LQLKVEHSLEVKRLKEQLISISSDCQKQKEANGMLNAHVRTMMQALENLQRKNNDVGVKLKEAEARNEELETCLKQSNELNQEQMEKSLVSFSKLQEAIRIADEAVVEVEALTNEKRQMEDECNNLAQTIGAVMEKASANINKDFEDLKAKSQRENEELSRDLSELVRRLDLEKEKLLLTSKQVTMLEEKVKSLKHENAALRKSLDEAVSCIEL